MPRLLRIVQRQGALIALILVCVFGFARYATFLTTENVLNVLRQNSMLAFVALGSTAVILTGGIDLSVGSVLAVAGLVAAQLSPYGTVVAVLAAVAVSAILGAINGLLVTRMGIQPFIATLATMIAIRGIGLGLTHENSIPLNASAHGLAWIGQGWIGPIPVPVVLFLLTYGLGWLVLRYTAYGRHVYAIGDDPIAAHLLGLNSDRILMVTYTLGGILAGVAGVVLAARLGAGQPVAGMGWELDAIAAVVVGGTLLTGGQGGVGLTLIGTLLLGVILDLLNLEGTFSPWWQGVIRGLFLLAVVVVQGRTQPKAAHD